MHLQLHLYRLAIQMIGLLDDDPLKHWQQGHGFRGKHGVFLARQRQQRADGLFELPHRLAHEINLLARLRGHLRIIGKAIASAVDHRQRRAQFMTGIAGELAFASGERMNPRSERFEATRQHVDFENRWPCGEALGWLLWLHGLDLGGQQDKWLCRPARQPESNQQCAEQNHRSNPGQPAQDFIAQSAHDQLFADLGDQKRRFRAGCFRMQATQVVVPPGITGILVARGIGAVAGREIRGKAGCRLVYLHGAATRLHPASGFRVVVALGSRFLFQAISEELILHRIREYQRKCTEQDRHEKPEYRECKHQATTQGADPLHWSATRRKPTP